MMPPREFTNADEMRDFYQKLKARTKAWAPRPAPPPAPEPEPQQAPEPPPFPARMTPVVRILVAVAAEFNIPPHVIKSGARTQDAIVPRQVVVLLAKELTNASNRMIGIVLGRRNHTTIMHSASIIKTKMAGNPALAGRVQRLRAKLLEMEFYHEQCDQDSDRARDCGQGGADAATPGPFVGGEGNG
jgi:hypothetical protein